MMVTRTRMFAVINVNPTVFFCRADSVGGEVDSVSAKSESRKPIRAQYVVRLANAASGDFHKFSRSSEGPIEQHHLDEKAC